MTKRSDEGELTLALYKASRCVHHAAAVLKRLSSTGAIGAVMDTVSAHPAMVGVGFALEPCDLLFGTRYDWPVAVGRGVAPQMLFAQALGVSGDPGLGRGMPGTLCHEASGVSLTDGNRASHLVHAAGFGHASRLRAGRAIALGMLSPASLQNGETHAALNFAAVYKAQSVFVARGEMYDDVRLAEVADAWGMWVSEVDGNDAVAVYGAMKEACERARKGKGPVLLDARVHQPCPETRQALAAEVRSNGLDADEIDETVRKRVEGALEAARGGGPVGDETLFEAVFSTRPWFLR